MLAGRKILSSQYSVSVRCRAVGNGILSDVSYGEPVRLTPRQRLRDLNDRILLRLGRSKPPSLIGGSLFVATEKSSDSDIELTVSLEIGFALEQKVVIIADRSDVLITNSNTSPVVI